MVNTHTHTYVYYVRTHEPSTLHMYLQNICLCMFCNDVTFGEHLNVCVSSYVRITMCSMILHNLYALLNYVRILELYIRTYQCMYIIGYVEYVALCMHILLMCRWWDKPISELKLQPHKISTGTTCSQAISYMKENSLLQVTVVSDEG